MSLVSGVGIHDAIQDAVVAVHVLSPKVKRGTALQERDLAGVQRQREWLIPWIQFIQARAQNVVFTRVLKVPRDRTVAVPRLVLPIWNEPRLLALPARLLSFRLYLPHVHT